jgi:hypothetical protein
MAKYYQLTKKEAEDMLTKHRAEYAKLDIVMHDLVGVGLVQTQLRLFNDEECTDLGMVIDLEDY